MGHVPRFVSKIMTYLLKAGGKVEATVTRVKIRKKWLGSHMLKGPKYAMDKT